MCAYLQIPKSIDLSGSGLADITLPNTSALQTAQKLVPADLSSTTLFSGFFLLLPKRKGVTKTQSEDAIPLEIVRGHVLVENGKIKAVKRDTETSPDQLARMLSSAGSVVRARTATEVLSPGFIDMQFNGGWGYEFTSGELTGKTFDIISKRLPEVIFLLAQKLRKNHNSSHFFFDAYCLLFQCYVGFIGITAPCLAPFPSHMATYHNLSTSLA